MEVANTEIVTECRFRASPKAAKPEVAQLVSERLARHADVTIHFCCQGFERHRHVLAEKGDRLIATPLLRVYTGIEYQPHGAPHLHFEAAVTLLGRIIKIHVLAQGLAVEGPAFEARSILQRTEAPKVGQL